MDGGSVNIRAGLAQQEIAVESVAWDTSEEGPPRRWLLFLAGLGFCAGTLIAIVVSVLPENQFADAQSPVSLIADAQGPGADEFGELAQAEFSFH